MKKHRRLLSVVWGDEGLGVAAQSSSRSSLLARVRDTVLLRSPITSSTICAQVRLCEVSV